jgi:internalin A
LHWGVDVPLPESAQEITALDLAGTDVSDKALKQLAKLKNLTTLELQNTKVIAAGLQELAGLKKLTALGLSAGQLSDANLRVLREIGLLHRLPQSGTGPNERPKSAAEVGALSLWHSPVTDEGLRELVGFKNLAWLDLRDTRVTDAGLKELAGLKNLATLFLQNTQVTEAGVAELQKALPKCDIRRRTMTGR